MPKMLKEWKRNSKRWKFLEILDFKCLNFFDKISNPYNKTTQEFYNFFWKSLTSKMEKKDVKNNKELKNKIVHDGILKLFCI